MLSAVGRLEHPEGVVVKRQVNRVGILRIDHEPRDPWVERKAAAPISERRAAIGRTEDDSIRRNDVDDAPVCADGDFVGFHWIHDAPGQTAIAALVQPCPPGRREDLLRIAARHGDVLEWGPEQSGADDPVLPAVAAPEDAIASRGVNDGRVRRVEDDLARGAPVGSLQRPPVLTGEE
jgi:hypothetical protein